MISADREVIISHGYFIGERHSRKCSLVKCASIRRIHHAWTKDELLDWCETQRMKVLLREAITRVHEASLKVIVWHEERDDELRCLLDLDVDGICTHDPERLKNLWDRTS